MIKRTTNHLETEHHHDAEPLKPLKVGVYAVECPACLAGPGEWCVAVFTLPPGTTLSRPHDDRVADATTFGFLDGHASP